MILVHSSYIYTSFSFYQGTAWTWTTGQPATPAYGQPPVAWTMMDRIQEWVEPDRLPDATMADRLPDWTEPQRNEVS